MKDNAFRRKIQSKLRRLDEKRNQLQRKIESISEESEILVTLKEIRSLDFDRYRLFKQLNGAV